MPTDKKLLVMKDNGWTHACVCMCDCTALLSLISDVIFWLILEEMVMTTDSDEKVEPML